MPTPPPPPPERPVAGLLLLALVPIALAGLAYLLWRATGLWWASWVMGGCAALALLMPLRWFIVHPSLLALIVSDSGANAAPTLHQLSPWRRAWLLLLLSTGIGLSLLVQLARAIYRLTLS